MNYVKKLCILKQIASGFAANGRAVSALLTAEKLGGRLTLALAPIGFAPLSAGRYRWLVCDAAGTQEVFDLPDLAGCTVKKTSDLNIADGFCCAVCFVSGKATPVAFGKCGEKTYDLRALCAPLTDSEAGPPAETPPAEEASAGEPPPYDDELLATENYFEFADADPVSRQIYPPEKDETAATAPPNDADAPAGDATASSNDADAPADSAGEETDSPVQDLFRRASAEQTSGAPTYYEQVKADLSALFDKHPAERELAECIPYSRWAKVTFSRNKFYTVGVISDEQKPKYICYGVPSSSRGEPPAALKGFCSYLPLSVFDLNGKGYWMMFQDAETGQCVRIRET